MAARYSLAFAETLLKVDTFCQLDIQKIKRPGNNYVQKNEGVHTAEPGVSRAYILNGNLAFKRPYLLCSFFWFDVSFLVE